MRNEKKKTKIEMLKTGGKEAEEGKQHERNASPRPSVTVDH